MTLQQLQYFRQLAETQHYTRTAEKLMVSQPSLSYAIAELEKELGTPLFRKQGRNVVLTEAGRIFAKHVDHALDELSLGRAEVQEHLHRQQNTLVVGYIFSLAQQVQQMITEFRSQPGNQDIRIRQKVSHSSTALGRDLISGSIEMAVCIDPPVGAQGLLLEEQTLCFVAAPDHPLSAAKTVTLQELLQYPLILVGEGTSLRGTILDFFEKNGVAPNIGFDAEECNAAAVLTAGGNGYSILPSTRNFAQEGLQTFSVENCTVTRPIYLAWSEGGDRELSRKFRAFAENYFAGQ